MYYDVYTQRIYEWLINNQIADKVNNIYSVLNNIYSYLISVLPDLRYIVFGLFFFGFLFFGLKFCRFRGLTL